MSNADAAAAAGLVVAGAMHKAAADGSLASLVSFQSSTSSAVPALLLVRLPSAIAPALRVTSVGGLTRG
jgi:hypothetical protein